MSTKNAGIRKNLGIAGRSEHHTPRNKKQVPPPTSHAGHLAPNAAPAHSPQAGDRPASPRFPEDKSLKAAEVAAAKKEVRDINRRVARLEHELKLAQLERRKNRGWEKSLDERLLRQKLELLGLRRRAVRRWLATHAPERTGGATKADAKQASQRTSGTKKGKNAKKKKKKAAEQSNPRQNRLTGGVSSGTGRRRVRFIT